MSEPTQAQIEAALNTFNHCMGEKAQNRRQAITAALTAAAGVSEEKTIGWSMAVTRLQNSATIDRCAQVAEAMEPLGYESVAAAIRALKDD